MVNFLSSLIDFLAMIGNYFENLVTSIASMLGLIAPSLDALTYFIGFMPSVLVAFASAGITICIVFHIIGR